MYCSIIIPLYNKAAFISDAIQSVLTQSHQNFEVIVVDDGSTDDGATRVKSIQDQRIKLIQQANHGVSFTRNLGIDLAKGDIVCFLDADDWYLPKYLETIVSMAMRYPDIPFFATHYKNISNLNQSDRLWDPGDTLTVELIDDIFYHWKFSHLFVTNSVAIRRINLIEFKPCFPLGEQNFEDQDLWFRLAEKYRLVYCSAPLVAYRKEVDGSLCALYEYRSLTPAYIRLEQRALDRQLPIQLRKSALRLIAEYRIIAARGTLRDGRRYDTLILLLNAWRGIVSKKWWMTMTMCIMCPSALVVRIDDWRQRQTRDW